MHNAPLRTEWDKFYVEYRTLGRLNDLNEYLYQAVKSPAPGIQSRDFCLFRHSRVDHDSKVYILLFKNSSHPDRPITPQYIRAKCIRSGYVIRPLPDDPTSCQMFVLSQNDVGGSLPRWLINFVAPRGVAQWYANFRKACEVLRSRLEVLAKEAASAGQAGSADTLLESSDLTIHLEAKFEDMALNDAEEAKAVAEAEAAGGEDDE